MAPLTVQRHLLQLGIHHVLIMPVVRDDTDQDLEDKYICNHQGP